MKHLYLLLLLFLKITTTQAQIVNIPDTNFKTKLLNHDPVIDINGDGEIQVIEAESFDEVLNVNFTWSGTYSTRILNLTGIEAFINIRGLSCKANRIPNLNLGANILLEELDCSANNMNNLDLTQNKQLTMLNCSMNSFQNLDVSQNTLLQNLNCDETQLSALDVSNNLDLKVLNVNDNEISTLNLRNNILLEEFWCFGNKLQTLDISQNELLQILKCQNNLLTELDVANNKELTLLDCSDNKLMVIDLSNNLKLEGFLCVNNLLTIMDFSQNSALKSINCAKNHIRYLDLGHLTSLESITCVFNDYLKSVNIKGPSRRSFFNFYAKNCPNLQTVCVDDVDYAIANYSSIDSHTTFVDDCSNTFSNNHNTIEGVIILDETNDGCNDFDSLLPNAIVKATNGVYEFGTLTNSNGFYRISVNESTYETSANFIFASSNLVVTPSSYEKTFVGFGQTEQNDFCVTFNQNSYDLNVKLIPIIPARPGFDATYQLVYENLGVTADSGIITLTFDDTMQSFVSASPAEDASTPNTLTFNFTNLKPFEKRVINVTMNTFTPPTVNGDDILNFVATITPIELDVTPDDNTYTLAQTVVNSFDPNDKQVLQGTEISLDETGNYLDYIIRFQNTGTASAINVAITDVLGPKLDWDSVKIISSSHPYTTRITNGNFVEFIFNNINLPAEQEDEPASHGFIAFKIKPRSTVVIGDIISGNANIYFDYNAPIETNWVSTQIVDEALSVSRNTLESELIIYPNPTKNLFNIKVGKGNSINKVAVFSVTGKQLLSINNSTEVVDLSSYKSGIYFVKVETNKGVFHKQIVKK